MRGFNPITAKLPVTIRCSLTWRRPARSSGSRTAQATSTTARGRRPSCELIAELRVRFGRSMPLEFRMDGAFFQQPLLKLLAREGCLYAVRVPFWK
jgi:hypothetical protein